MACKLMCPGTQMELFSHKTATETSEQMVSTVDGTLYTSLKTAFAHREKFDPKCACNFKLVKRSYNIDIPDSVWLAKLTNSFFKEKKTALPAWRSDQQVEPSPRCLRFRKLMQIRWTNATRVVNSAAVSG